MSGQGRRALITGGAAGIGAAIAAELHAAGHACTITGRAADRPGGLDLDISYLQLDYLDPDSLTRACETWRRCGLRSGSTLRAST